MAVGSTPYRRALCVLGWWDASDVAAVMVGTAEGPPMLWHNRRLVPPTSLLVMELWARYALTCGQTFDFVMADAVREMMGVIETAQEIDDAAS